MNACSGTAGPVEGISWFSQRDADSPAKIMEVLPAAALVARDGPEVGRLSLSPIDLSGGQISWMTGRRRLSSAWPVGRGFGNSRDRTRPASLVEGAFRMTSTTLEP